MKTNTIHHRRGPVFLALVAGIFIVALAGAGTDGPPEAPAAQSTGVVVDQPADASALEAKTFQAEQRIIDVAITADGGLICFIDNHGNVSLADTTSGELLWTRNVAVDDAPPLYENEVTWGQCEFTDTAGTVAVGYSPNFNWISILPADSDQPIEGFWASGWTKDDIRDVCRGLDRRRKEAGETVREHQGTGSYTRLARWLNWKHADTRQRIHEDREAARALCESESLGLDGVPYGIGLVVVRGRTGILTSIPARWYEGTFPIYSADDLLLSWWFKFGTPGRVVDNTEDLSSFREEIGREGGTAYLGTFHKYVDDTNLDQQKRSTWVDAPPTDRAGTSRSDGQSYVYFGGTAKIAGGQMVSHIEGCGWTCVGKIGDEGQVDWRIFMTAGMRNFAVDGYEILVLYPSGRIVVWSMAREGGGQPELLAEGQAVETRNITQTAVAFQHGVGVVSIEDQYWVVRGGQVEGPYEAEGEITSIALAPPYWVYGTADGKIIFDRLDTEQPVPSGD